MPGGCSGIFLLTDPGDVLSSYAFIYKYIKMEKVKLLSHVLLFVAPWTVAHQAPPSIGFSRHEYWSGLPFLSLGDLPDPGTEPGSPALQADSLLSECEDGEAK